MKRAPRSRQRHDLYAKYHDYDSEISDLLGECGFICGPADFMEGTRQALIAAGVARDRIAIEAFVSLANDPFAPVAATALPVGDGPSVTADVDLYGDTFHLDWPQDTLLLDLLLHREIDAPYLCREGACHSCTCTLEAGRVRMLEEGIVEAEPGGTLILACQSMPDGVDVSVRFLN